MFQNDSGSYMWAQIYPESIMVITCRPTHVHASGESAPCGGPRGLRSQARGHGRRKTLPTRLIRLEPVFVGYVLTYRQI